MTKLPMGERCRWCGRVLPQPAKTGRPRQYCRQGCRQQAHLARRFAEVHGLGDGDVIIDRQVLEELQGALYCLEAAIEDVDADLADAPSADEVASALRWLLENARPLAAMQVEPKAATSSLLDIT